MIVPAAGLVIDASAAIPLFIPEPISGAVEGIFLQLGQESCGPLSVPDLFYIEIANVLHKHAVRGNYDAKDAGDDLARLQDLRLAVFSTRPLVQDSFALARVHGLSAYDACYVALARHLRVPLVTADEKLATKVPKAVCQIHVLS